METAAVRGTASGSLIESVSLSVMMTRMASMTASQTV
jgi:hypothetical protein